MDDARYKFLQNQAQERMHRERIQAHRPNPHAALQSSIITACFLVIIAAAIFSAIFPQ